MAEHTQILPVADEQEITGRIVPVLLGSDLLTYTWARVFNETYGVKSLVFSSILSRLISDSDFVEYFVVDDVDQEEYCMILLRELGPYFKETNQIPVLLGTGDWYARILARNKDELSQWFVVPYLDFDKLNFITQKSNFYDVCEKLGIPHPKTWKLDCSDSSADLPWDEITYPVVAKPSSSADFHYADIENPEKVYFFNSEEGLRALAKQLKASNYNNDLLVQERIPGEDDTEWSITCFSDQNGEVHAWATGNVLLQEHGPAAMGNPAVIDVVMNKAIQEDAAKIIREIGIEGFSNFDAKYDRTTGTYKFLEVNTRAGRNTYYMHKGGVNIAKLIVDHFVLGKEIPFQVADKEILFCVVPPMVLRHAIINDEVREHALSLMFDGKAYNPLFDLKDSLAHNYWAFRTYLGQIKRFKKYYWNR